MYKMMIKLLSAVLALLLCVPAFGLCEEAEEIPTIVTIVPAPEQTQAERPSCFPDPTENYIPLPETENFAEGKPVKAGIHADVYVIRNINDGKTDTYWESKGVPAEVIIDLEQATKFSTVAVCLNPASIWEPRIQEIAVQISMDGENYTEAAPAVKYQFEPATGNRIRIDFDAAEARYVKVIFSMNSASRSQGAQAAEICVY